MFKINDLVSRKSHGNDVVFKIVEIDGEIAYLTGIDIRLCADSFLDDLVLVDRLSNSDDNFYKKINEIRNFSRSDYFYLPGKILHIDGDKEYLDRCLEFYKKANVLAFGVYSPENKMPENIEKYLEDINPDIVVITGHDSKIKNNSTYFCEAVKVCRKYQKDYDNIKINKDVKEDDVEFNFMDKYKD